MPKRPNDDGTRDKNSPYKGKGTGSHPNSLKALQSNRGQGVKNAGRKHGTINVKSRILKYLDIEVPLKLPDGSTENAQVADTIIIALIQQAQRGNIKAAELLFDRGYGKQEQVIDVKDDRIEKLGANYSQRLSDAYDRIEEIIDSRPGIDHKESVKN